MQNPDKIFTSRWRECADARGVLASRILSRDDCIEGIDINRYSANAGAQLRLETNDAHIFSLLAGTATLRSRDKSRALTITTGNHIFLPPKSRANIEFSTNCAAIHAATDAAQSRGTELLIHNERFLAPTRFVLTPQYLSRRAFLHRDKTLLSRSGDPIAWFHTTMFDTDGLPKNSDDLDVFKMSYDYQSEINVVYDVQGTAKVRFAHHPYTSPTEQAWSPWSSIDSETTYCLNESAQGEHAERVYSEETGADACLRNRHEIHVESSGYVSLCCLFDPGPTGLEVHQPGEYSSYGAVEETLKTEQYKQFLKDIAPQDIMIRGLSLLVAENPDAMLKSSRHWKVFETALAKARILQREMINGPGVGRESIIEAWRLKSVEN